LAIITMQTMPMISWNQRLVAGATAGAREYEALCIGGSSPRMVWNFCGCAGAHARSPVCLTEDELKISRAAVNRDPAGARRSLAGRNMAAHAAG
jgi:hypothetical protein